MKNMGFLRVAAAMPVVHVADPEANAKEIIALADTLAAEEPSVIVFPELCITGYSCADLFAQQGIIGGAEKAIADYDVRPAMKKLPVQNLSGGNQQKVILARWLSRDVDVLILDEPTVGVDVGVKAELYVYMRKLADKGAIIIMVSSDLAELTEVSDRVLVLHNGTFFQEFRDHKATQQAVLLASSGVAAKEGVVL